MGGQKARLKFAALSLHPAHILFLDEPTNHLDAESCEALANGLAEFRGGIVAVTHDDLLIYRLIQCSWSDSELLVCQDGCIRRQASLGTHCLNALKDQVRRSEEDTVVDVHRHATYEGGKETPQGVAKQALSKLEKTGSASDANAVGPRGRSQS